MRKTLRYDASKPLDKIGNLIRTDKMIYQCNDVVNIANVPIIVTGI